MSQAPAQQAVVHIVDDDEAVRDSLAFLLESAGHAVAAYPGAGAFLAAGVLAGPGCLVADIRMPEMDGLALQERLNALGSTLPVVIVTGHGDVPLAVRAMKAGAVDFVEKPFSEEAILDAVGRALERSLAAPAPDTGLGPAPQPAADPALAERVAALTPREREVLEALVAGHPNKVIAHLLGISARTVEIHRARVMDKMQARSLSQLVRDALAAGVAGRA